MPVDSSVLVAKLRRGGTARSPLPDAALIGDGLARHAEDRLRPVLRCPIAFEVRACRASRLGEAAAEIGTPSMIGLVRLAGSDAPAIVALDSALAWHLIDITLGGASDEAASVMVRSFTGIDLALGRLFLEPLADALGLAIGEALGRGGIVAFRLAEQRQAMAQVQIAPDHADVLRIRLDAALGEARRAGRIDVVVPLATLDAIRAAVARTGAAQSKERPDDLWRTAMRQAAAQAPVTLDAVMHRERMTLAAVRRLRPGDVIEIDAGAPGAVALTLSQPGGRIATIAHARLGAYRDNKVLRLATEPEPRLAAQVRGALYTNGSKDQAADRPALPAAGPLTALPSPDAATGLA